VDALEQRGPVDSGDEVWLGSRGDRSASRL
jgi:hypothetical protein